MAGAMICDGVCLGLLVGSVPAAQASPLLGKVLILCATFLYRMWSAWECWALLREFGGVLSVVSTAQQSVEWLVPALVIFLLHGAVWFALLIGPFDDFTLVSPFFDTPRLEADVSGCLLRLSPWRNVHVSSRDVGSVEKSPAPPKLCISG